jgi:glycosyltransferase involved in cell wall biosynthesis
MGTAASSLAILHVDTEPTWRGGQEALFSLVVELKRRGHRQHIACPARSELARVALEAGIDLTPLGGSRELRRTLLREKFDVLHSHSGRAQNLAFLAGLGRGIKRVVTRHVAFPPRNPAIHRWKYTHTCDGIIAVSNAVRDVLVTGGVPAEMIEVIRTGIAFPQAVPVRSQRLHARQQFGLSEDAFVIGQLGAFTREKGQDVAIAAWEQLGLPGSQLILAGDGQEREGLAEANPGVLFPGFVEDRALFYAALDVLVMPSRSEAWGLAALEAMAHALPVIASDVGGLREMISDRATGLLVPVGDAPALADGLRWVAGNADEARLIGEGARESVRQFSITATAEQTEQFYRRVLGFTPQ